MMPFFLSVLPVAWAQERNHSMEILPDSVVFQTDQAEFSARAIGASALNLSMTSQVFNSSLTLIATGNAVVFTQINLIHQFTVPFPEGSFGSGEQVGVSVSDIVGSPVGDEGALIFANFLVSVPTLKTFALILFVLGTLVFGIRHIKQAKTV